MKLPKLIKTLQQLRKILRRGPIKGQVSWDRQGPCPQFLCSPACEITVQNERYLVFMQLKELEDFCKDLQEKDRRKNACGKA